eukprot:CAMPEP_0118870580 /NCGR_PEP_ID=MMETSP1163-20130328/13491_1 /TAXON_ID=124430 /ORGANISM="Phaeomonas parva, Strain CCMP2877" /LENGTH=52 /DNA_ID=CAMNT_0006805593 /DNA_START=33 /DNA_END=191 /DNA_ORIENTATION=+
MKTRLALMQARLTEVQNVIKLKNPSLLLQLQRNPSATLAPSQTNNLNSSRRG